jgi:putative oxidoreductase
MKGYVQWLSDLHFPVAYVFVYAGKLTELLGGILLALGLFTRLASIFLVLTFTLITFVMGEGKIFTDAQHPFLFIMLSLVFLFAGAGSFSLDHCWFRGDSEKL